MSEKKTARFPSPHYTNHSATSLLLRSKDKPTYDLALPHKKAPFPQNEKGAYESLF